ncbi:MAG: hypothetical protein ACREEM_20215, partial [Blastocatellia bacterium]
RKAVASGESRGVCSKERETPRRKAVASGESRGVCSKERETPRRKAVASGESVRFIETQVAYALRTAPINEENLCVGQSSIIAVYKR